MYARASVYGNVEFFRFLIKEAYLMVDEGVFKKKDPES